MSFRCPECSNPSSLKIKKSIELPPDSRSDEITLQLVNCTNCSFRGIAVYEESRRGRLGEESFNHIGYYTDDQSFERLDTLIKNCPIPKNKKCDCDSHQQLGSRNQSGRFVGLFLFNLNSQFQIMIHYP